MKTVFVTGATGLLGNNLVKELVAQGIQVKALIRNPEKAATQFPDQTNIEFIHGDMSNVKSFIAALEGCDTVFHAAAYFRDSYKGGNHWDELYSINVKGTSDLIEGAYNLGIRHFIQTSSIATLDGPPGSLIDETCSREVADADDYYRSKILTDQVIQNFIQTHQDMKVAFVLPGWMWGPGDIGPTSAGQLLIDVSNQRLPGLIPGSFSVVDARDVATAQISAANKIHTSDVNGEKYLVAGRHMVMKDLIPVIGRIAKITTPQRYIPLPLLYIFAIAYEFYARITGNHVLISLATVKLMSREMDRTHFDSSKATSKLGIKFRPLQETIQDSLNWYQQSGWLKPIN